MLLPLLVRMLEIIRPLWETNKSLDGTKSTPENWENTGLLREANIAALIALGSSSDLRDAMRWLFRGDLYNIQRRQFDYSNGQTLPLQQLPWETPSLLTARETINNSKLGNDSTDVTKGKATIYRKTVSDGIGEMLSAFILTQPDKGTRVVATKFFAPFLEGTTRQTRRREARLEQVKKSEENRKKKGVFVKHCGKKRAAEEEKRANLRIGAKNAREASKLFCYEIFKGERLVPVERRVPRVWSTEDKDSPIRVCMDLNTGEATNVELKLSDATANVYLELATILAAGIDGIKRERKLRPAMTDVAESEPLPGTLQESLDLVKQNELLLSVLGPELSTAYIAVRELEAQIEKTLEEEVIEAYNKA